MPANTGFSDHPCSYCKQVGAECVMNGGGSGKLFCNEDCYRASAAMKSCAEALFEGKTVLCGYSAETGMGGYCANCSAQPATISCKLETYNFGICSQPCAQSLNARYTAEVKQTGVGLDDVIPRWLRKPIFHKAYRVKDIVEAATMLWNRTACLAQEEQLPEGPARFDKAMAEVFSILAASKVFEQQTYNGFARFAEYVVEKDAAYFKGLEPKYQDGPRKEKYEEHKQKELAARCNKAMKKFEQSAEAVWNARYIARLVKRLYKLYYYHEKRVAKHAPTQLEEVARANRGSKEDIAARGGAPLDEGQHTLAHDLHLALHELIIRFGNEEAATLLLDGLLMEITRARPFGSSGTAVPPEQDAKIIQASLEGSPDVKPIAPNWFQRRWQDVKDLTKGGVYGKGYSVSSVIAVFYELWLMNNCGVPEARAALNYKTKIGEAVNMMRQLYGNASTPDAKTKMVYYPDYWNRFAQAAAAHIQLTEQLQQSRDKVRVLTPNQTDNACHKSRARSADTTIVQRLEKEIRAMYTYCMALTAGVLRPSVNAPSGKTLTPTQKEFNSDLAMIYKELSKKIGSDTAKDYLLTLFNTQDDGVGVLPAAAAAAVAPTDAPTIPTRRDAPTPPAPKMTTTRKPPSKVKALYDYTAQTEDELSMKKDQVLTLVGSPDGEAEWIGVADPAGGASKWVPKNHVQVY